MNRKRNKPREFPTLLHSVFSTMLPVEARFCRLDLKRAGFDHVIVHYCSGMYFVDVTVLLPDVCKTDALQWIEWHDRFENVMKSYIKGVDYLPF